MTIIIYNNNYRYTTIVTHLTLKKETELGSEYFWMYIVSSVSRSGTGGNEYTDENVAISWIIHYSNSQKFNKSADKIV